MGAPPADSRFEPVRGQDRSVTSTGRSRKGAIRESSGSPAAGFLWISEGSDCGGRGIILRAAPQTPQTA